MISESNISDSSAASCCCLLGFIFNQMIASYNNKQAMNREEEKDELNVSSANIAVAPVLAAAEPMPAVAVAQPSVERVRHVYLEEENVYGRFVPFLLLKDKLHSQIDSSGSSALVHMCSHNSPYLPLYLSTLKQGDPILNRPTNLGHTPLDVAGMYCKKEYIDLLRAKGAIDDGKVDNWAIQGANIANWSGNVDPTKKALIHWAAYNNLPEVLAKYAQLGADVNESDHNGNTPIDLAVLNKSYESVQVLARLGFRPKQTLLQKADSPYLTKLIAELDTPAAQKNIIRSLKLSFVPLLLLSQYLLNTEANIILILTALVLWLALVIRTPVEDSKERPTAFFSELVNRQINYASNHKIYVLMMLILVLNGLENALELEVESFSMAIYFWVQLIVTLTFAVNLWTLAYGIFTNTTPSELFEAHKHPQLWRKIEYIIHRNMLTRTYHNPQRKDLQSNLQAYLSS